MKIKKSLQEQIKARFFWNLNELGGLFKGLYFNIEDKNKIKERMKKALKKTVEWNYEK